MKFSEITKVNQLLEIIDEQFDGAGLIVTDGEELATAIARTFPELVEDLVE